MLCLFDDVEVWSLWNFVRPYWDCAVKLPIPESPGGQIRFEITCLLGRRHDPAAGKAEGACILSDSTPMLSGRSRTWVNDSATSTMTAHAS